MERKLVEKEVNDDMKKSYLHLLGDVYEELFSSRPPEYNMLHAQKRMMTLFAKMGFDAASAQNQMIWLTRAVVMLTGVVVLLGLVQVFLFTSRFWVR